MVEVPEELRQFNINFVSTGKDASLPNFLLQPILEDVIVEVKREAYAEAKANFDEELIRELVKKQVENYFKGEWAYEQKRKTSIQKRTSRYVKDDVRHDGIWRNDSNNVWTSIYVLGREEKWN